MKRSRIAVGVVAAIALVAVSSWMLMQDSSCPAPAPAAPTGAAGFVAGELDPGAKAAEPALSTSAEGLVAEPSPVPGGGMMIDLQGRFQNAATATVDDSGQATVDCTPADSAGGER
jgi:hypothetical protein